MKIAGALLLAQIELLSGNSMTETMIQDAQSQELIQFGISLMGLIITGLLVVPLPSSPASYSP